MSPVPRTVRAATALAALAVACGDGSTPPTSPARYRVEVSGEAFVVEVATPAQVEAMEARLAAGEPGVINGELVASDGGFNAPWSWHLDPGTVEAPDFAIEVCDGRPSFVEEDLEHWLGTVGRFCPWSARVVGRVAG